MRRFTRAVLIFIVATGAPLSAQQVAPAWLLVARADRLLESSEIGLAIRTLRQALELEPDSPEANFALGRAYAATGIPGDFAVADDYFARALAHRDRFTVPDNAILVRYARADLYRMTRDFARYERELLLIIDEAPLPDDVLLPVGLSRRIATQGIDRTMILYRADEDGATDARGRLATLFVGLGRYDDAATNAAVSVVQAITTLVDGVLARDPLFEYTTLEALLDRARRYEETRRHIDRTTLFRDLYYLAAAWLGSGERSAVTLWQRIAAIPEAGTFATRASVQARDPQPEPLLVPLP